MFCPLGIVNELGPLPAYRGYKAQEREHAAKLSFVRILFPGASVNLVWKAVIQGHESIREAIRILHTRLPDQAFRGYLGQTRVEIHVDVISQIRSAVPEIEYEDDIIFEPLTTYGDVEQANRNLQDRVNTLNIGSRSNHASCLCTEGA